jgi:hypothetical protein
MRKFYQILPTPQSVVLEERIADTEYYRIKKNSSPHTLLGKMEENCLTNLNNKFQHFVDVHGISMLYNTNEFHTIEQDIIQKRVLVKTNNHNYSEYYVYVFFLPKNAEMVFLFDKPKERVHYQWDCYRKTFDNVEDAKKFLYEEEIIWDIE